MTNENDFIKEEQLYINQGVEIISEYSDYSLAKVLDLEKKCFPEDWQYDNADTYYKEMLFDKDNINIFLKNEGSIVGYALAKPLKNAMVDLRDIDPGIVEVGEKMYIETIQILDEFRGTGGAKKILLKICDEAFNRGILNFAIHARKSNNLNVKIKKIFDGMITTVRQIESWPPGGGEPYEYIEWKYKK